MDQRHKRISRWFTRVHGRLEKRMASVERREWRKIAREIARRYRESEITNPEPEDLYRPEEFYPAWSDAMKPELRRAVLVGIQFENDVVEQLLEADRAEQSGRGIRSWSVVQNVEEEDIYIPDLEVPVSRATMVSVNQFLDSRDVGLWATQSRRVTNMLKQIMRESVAEGLTRKETSLKIMGAVDGYKGWQASRVARTENTGGMNFGANALRKDLGITHKEWISTLDSRVRRGKYDHLKPNGVIVTQGEAFLVSGEELHFPGDNSKASAGNVVNCRCSAISHFKPTARPKPKPNPPKKKRTRRKPAKSAPAPKKTPTAPSPDTPPKTVSRDKRPALPSGLRKVPGNATGQDTEFSHRVYRAIGNKGPQTTEDVNAVGKLVREEMEARAAARGLSMDNKIVRQDLYREVVGEVRNLGGQMNFRVAASDQAAMDSMNRASQYIPEDWIDLTNKNRPEGAVSKVVDRAYYAEGHLGMEVHTSPTRKIDPNTLKFVAGEPDDLISMHEMIHMGEDHASMLARKSAGQKSPAELMTQKILDRAGDEVPHQIARFGDRAKYLEDEFFDAYVGRQGRKGFGAEIPSHTIETFLRGPFGPVKDPYKHDLDMVDFALGIMVAF